MNSRKDAWGYVLGHRTGKKTAGKIYTVADVYDAMLIVAMLERLEYDPMVRGYRTNYPAHLVKDEWTAYGYTEADSRYQPTAYDVTLRNRVEPLLAECKRDCDRKAVDALFIRYRIGQGGVTGEDKLVSWHIIGGLLRCSAERAIAYADEAAQWLAERLGRSGIKTTAKGPGAF